MKMAVENCLEDYWEDASVSWGCRGLSVSSFSHTQQAQRDTHITAPSTLRPRSFPPPIAFCTTLSIKAGGRFVLKEMVSLPPHSFRAEREQGRLCLHLIEPMGLDDEDEEDDDDNYDDVCNGEDTVVCAVQQDGCMALATEDMNENTISHEQTKHELIQGLPEEIVGEAVINDKPEKHVRTGESSTSEKQGIEHIEPRDNSIGACMMPTSIVCTNEMEIKNKGSAYMGVLGISQQQRSCLWSKEGRSNEIAAASLSPCSSNQVLSHESFARASPALGLAVS